MYQLFYNNLLLYDKHMDELKLLDPRLNLELNTAGDFTFQLLPTHPYVDKIEKMKSIIKLYQDGKVIFRGRVLNTKDDFNKIRTFMCEGDMAFLNDTIQRPFNFQGTPEELFTYLIENHNAQVDDEHRFKKGIVTVTDPNQYINRSDSQYSKTLTLIKSQLIDTLGGYLWIRYEADGTYIDYLDDFDLLNPQKIELGENLLDLSNQIKGESIITAVIPLGAKLSEDTAKAATSDERLTISEVNDGKDYVYDAEAVKKHNWIYETVIFDDVTVPSNLKKKGEDYLKEKLNLLGTIEISAVDLARYNPKIKPFRMGAYVQVESKAHNLVEQLMLIRKMSIVLFSPASNRFTLGISYKTLSDKLIESEKDTNDLIIRVEEINKDYQVNIERVEENFTSLIEQTANNIKMEVSESTTAYIDGEIEKVLEEQNTRFEQTSNSFEFSFNQLKVDLDEYIKTGNTKFEEIHKYIRFEDGNIILGETGNEIVLTIQNDKIVFTASGKEVAYFSSGKLYITDAEILGSLRIGNFAFIPRANGNLSFKKVR